YLPYWQKYAQTWERQTLLRARPAAGDADLGRRFLEVASEVALGPGLSPEAARDVRHMKARMERERIPAGEDRDFHLKLGRGSLTDVQFTVQLLQMRHRVPGAGLADAAAALVGAGHLSPADAETLLSAHRY